jgi:ribonuclease P protein component
LLIPGDFQRVFKHGKKRRGAFFMLISCENGGKQARLGLAIAKRHVPLAVARNRVRRIIRESFRHYQSALKGKDIVVIAQTPLLELCNLRLKEELTQQWQGLVGS